MNWLQKIFNPSSKKNSINGNDILSEVAIDENVFIDSDPPMEGDLSDFSRTNFITVFLERDFAYKGRIDGYEYHSEELLANSIRRIKADFRLALDNEIDAKRKVLQQLEDDSINSGSISEKLIEQFDKNFARLKDTIDRYEHEKVLSVDDEGWVMKPIHEYRDGFIRGMQDYYQEKNLGLETGLFN